MSDREESLRKAEETMRRLQHEVRTPLGQIKGYSEMIEEELEDYGAEELAPDLQKIRQAADRLLELMDGKLRTDAGARRSNSAWVGWSTSIKATSMVAGRCSRNARAPRVRALSGSTWPATSRPRTL